MHRDLLPLLACPETGAPLELADAEFDGRGRVVTGRLTTRDGRSYPIRGSIPRFVDSDLYCTSFSMQRRYLAARFDHWVAEKGRETLFEVTTGFRLADARGKLFLDAGCGYGRFAHTVAEAGGIVVGMDLSTDSIELAFRYLGDRDNVHLVQADLQRPPFRRDLFAGIYSIGVLHHTPSTAASFRGLVPLLEPGGRIAVWVYAPEDKRMDNVLRIATTRMPPWSVFCVGVARHVLGQTARRVVRRRPQATLLRDFWPGVMGQFDSLAPRYAHVHAFDEVEGWFRTAGLGEIRRSTRRTAVSGARSRDA
jgi:SAM-dependent methyltransferase